jgi:O-antigen/teichoic acid export membrane protein
MIKQIRESEFLRQIFVLFTGSLISQILPFALLPILQKYYYSPSDFGIFVLFFSFAEIFSTIATLKLEYGIVVQATLRKAVNLMFGALRISCLVTVLSFSVIFFFKEEIARQMHAPGLENYLLLLPLFIFLFSFNEIASYWFNRKKNFSIISTSKVVQTGTAETIKLATGIANFNFSGLILGRIFGYFFSGSYYLIRFFQRDKRTLKLISYKESNQLIKANKSYIYFTTPSVFLGTFINFAYLSLFSFYFGKEIVGMIGISMSYLSAGFGIISISFSQVFYSKIAEIKDKVILLQTYKRFAKNLMFIAFAPILFVYLIPVDWITYLLGEKWNALIPIARIMVLWLSVWFVASSLSFIYIRLGKQKLMVFYDFLHLLLIIIGFFAGYAIGKTHTSSLIGFTVAQIIYYFFAVYIAIYYIKRIQY